MYTPTPTVELAMQLISLPSVTPEDAGCQTMMIDRLDAVGFTIYRLPYGAVNNFWAVHGSQGPIFCFAGHTDVVPTGPVEQWTNQPFKPTIMDGQLYGRGAADMKGSLAAMVVAAEKFVVENPNHKGRLGFLITSDEEGDAVDGTVRVVEWLKSKDMIPKWCLVGEPSSSLRCGDTIKNGRRGSLGCCMRIKGVQGHVAYPDLASNPIHLALPALSELTTQIWDTGNSFFPATSFQISNINSGTGATNVIPGEIEVLFNFRFSTEVTDKELQERVIDILNRHNLDYSLDWNLSGQPFLTPEGLLVAATVESIEAVTGLNSQLSTAGGTSDGRFIAPAGSEVVELGPINKTIHRVDENISVTDLDDLALIYQQVVSKLLL